MIDQISVFLENREGRLAALCRCLGDANVNMSTLTIADTTEFGLVRIIADDPQGAVDALDAAGFRAALTRVSAIEVPNRPGGLAELLELLDDLDVNIEYGYCFSLCEERAVEVIKIRETPEVTEAIEKAGFRILKQSDISI